MKAIVKYEKGDGFMELRDVPMPKVRYGEVLIKIYACGVCGSDIHIWHDEHPNFPPVIVGHEFSGEVVEVGEGVEGFSPGDRVVGETHTRTCGRCIYCKTGNQHVCISKRAPGWGIDGAFAEFISYPSRLLHKIPDGVHWDDAALAEPVAICCHAIAERALRQGSDLTSSVGNEVACVIGPGPIGLISLQLLKSLGVSKCIVLGTERSAKLRLKTAEMLGADVIINVDREDAVKTISDITSGLGADIVIETSGSERGILMAGRLARRMGTVCHLGISGKESLQIHHDEYIFKALTVVYSFSHRYTSWETALGLIKRSRIDTSRLITHRAPLKEWRELFELIERREAIKAVIKPHSS